MKLKKIKTVSVLEFVPPHPLMLVKRSKDLQYIDTLDWNTLFVIKKTETGSHNYLSIDFVATFL